MLGLGSKKGVLAFVLSNLANSQQSNPRFGAKVNVLVAIMAKVTCLYGCTVLQMPL